VDRLVDAASPVIDRGDNTEVPPSLVTDLAGDPRITDAADIATMLGAWGPCGASCAADLDGSGAVDAADLALLLGAWR
jgi:hypothetical protein